MWSLSSSHALGRMRDLVFLVLPTTGDRRTFLIAIKFILHHPHAHRPPLTCGFFFPFLLFGVFLGVETGVLSDAGGTGGGSSDDSAAEASPSDVVAPFAAVLTAGAGEPGAGDAAAPAEEAGFAAAPLTCFAGVAGDSGNGVVPRLGGADVVSLAERGALAGEGISAGPGAGEVPAAGKGFEGARVREEGVR